ncbi:hypothetical protein [Cellulomonas palmilytica]|uniref:hypothetical protein n=1 Tax=Cellulomonas palmilytica TaxID=2608402 RepID=UPI001F326960|nr:hypothetical protein [Cellulomonas palmilytica]UJP40652.1 hypothetical protein F1D97_03875 [Cellulomonas palmilytica]
MGPTPSWARDTAPAQADAPTGLFSRIAAEPGEVIRGQDPDGLVTVGRDLAGAVVEVRLADGWRTRASATTLGGHVTRAHQASGLEYLRRRFAASRGEAASVPVPRQAQPAVAPATYSSDELLEALTAQEEEQPRLEAAQARRLAPRQVSDPEGWITATVVGENVQALEIDALRLRVVPDAGVEQALVRVYARAAAAAAEEERAFAQEFPATARLAEMSAAIQQARTGGRS